MRDRRRTGLRGARSLRHLLLVGCASISLISLRAEAAGTLPSGGHFMAGTGGIATSGVKTTVTQSSQRGIVDWNSFSIGKGNTVQFDNGSGATLNKVTGGSLSTIAGRLTATGSVYLINPNGVVVGPGGKVMTGGTFALIGVIFARTGGGCAGRFATETIEKPIICVETSGMISVICAPIGATCAMIVVTYGMTAATPDATTEGKFSSVPGGGPRERRLASPAAAFRNCEPGAATDER